MMTMMMMMPFATEPAYGYKETTLCKINAFGKPLANLLGGFGNLLGFSEIRWEVSWGLLEPT